MIMQMPKFWKIGHRGAAGYEPENTLRSFEKALELKADAIEFDVRKTKDGKLAIMHDATVDRTTNGRGLIKDFTLKELWRLDAGKGEIIPELADVFCCFGHQMFLHVELKEKDLAEQVSRLANVYDCLDTIIVSAFPSLWGELFSMKTQEPSLKIGLAVGKTAEAMLALDIASEKDIFSIHALFAESLHLKSGYVPAGIRIFSWTINKPEETKKVKEWGVDGAFSDYPDRL